MSNCSTTTRRNHWRVSGAGLASGVLVIAAVTGISTAHIDPPALVDVSATPVELTALGLFPTPTDLLDGAVANFTDANQVLTDINLADFPSFASFVGTQIGVQNSALSTISALQSSQDVISQNSAPFGVLADLWFYLVNVGWYLDSQAALSLDQAMDSALANGSLGAAGLANFGLYVVDVGIFGDAFSSFSINLLSSFF